jgi:polysaccharide deacetylase 2 family uncharacterized protein YibQ
MPYGAPFANGPGDGHRRGIQILAAATLFVAILAIAATAFVLVAGRADGGTPRVILSVAEPTRAPPPPFAAPEQPAAENLGTQESAPAASDESAAGMGDSSTTAPVASDSEGSDGTAASPGETGEALEGTEATPADSAQKAPAPTAANPASGGESAPADAVALAVPGAGSVPDAAASVDALPAAPDPALVAYGKHGPLPVIAPDGRRPLDVYARPFDRQDKRPRIAIIVGGLGLSRATTEAAIAMLPAAVTLSFTPYAKDLQRYLNSARAAGHEVILELPMEPFDYPHNDPGPFTLLTQVAFEENEDKLEWLMSRFTGYAGVVNDQGEKMLSAGEDLKPVLKDIDDRGLYFLDRGTAKNSAVAETARALGLPFAIGSGPIDAQASRDEIESRLQRLEDIARQKGSAIGSGFNYPVTIERVRDWSETLDKKGLVLAPVSAVLATPKASGAT